MIKIKDKNTAYQFLESPLFNGDTSLYTFDELVEAFETRFSPEILVFDFLNEIKLYEVTVDKTKELLSSVNIVKQKDLALLLVKTIHNNYCNENFLASSPWFLAGVIFTCFNCLKEDDQKIREAFLSFSKQEGASSSFCRLIVISAIEYYCRVQFRDDCEGYKTIIRFDGEVVEDIKNSKNEDVFRQIWFKWCNNNIANGNKVYRWLLKLDCYSYNRYSLYWATRPEQNSIHIFGG